MSFRALVTAGKQQIEGKTPIHIADLQSMTDDFARRLRKERPGSHDDDAGGVASTDARKVTRPAEPEASSGREIGPSDVSERTAEKAENAVNAGRRVRKQRVLTNVASLGEIHLVESGHIPSLLQEADCVVMSDSVQYRKPESYQGSLRCLEAAEWRTARKLERRALIERGVIRLVPTPPGVKAIKSRYVYRRKYNKDGSIKKYKARLVALGFGQVSGVDVFNTFAPVVKSITVRLLIALAFIFNMHIHQLDVSNAFCYADIEGDVYMQSTPNFELPLGHCFILLKSLYGLRSSPRSWLKNLDKYIKSLHFVPCVLKPCMYHMQYKGTPMYLCIYVNDIIIACSELAYICEIKQKLRDRYDVIDMGALEHFLNVRVTRAVCIQSGSVRYI